MSNQLKFLTLISLIGLSSCIHRTHRAEDEHPANTRPEKQEYSSNYQGVTGKANPDYSGNETFDMVEQMPEFPGGEAKLIEFIGRNLHYPISAQENGIQGRVIIRFVVTKTGKVDKVEILRSLDPECDKEAVRVIKSLPRWHPGKQKGENVNVYYTLPITYKLE